MKRSVVLLMAVLAVSGCTASRNAILTGGSELTNEKICRRYSVDTKEFKEKPPTKKQAQYLVARDRFMAQRGLNAEACERFVRKESRKVALFALSAAAVGAGVYAASRTDWSGPGYGGYGGGYAWNGFYDHYGNYVWRCTNRSNGRWAENYHCATYAKVDNTWPGPYQ